MRIAFALLAGLLLAAGEPDDEIPVTPDKAFLRAAFDLSSFVPPDRRRTTRYLSLHAIPPADRAAFTKALVFALNSTSWRTQFGRPVPIADGLILRLDLESLGWDRDSRAARLKRFETAGVKFPEDQRSRIVDIWEQFAASDPYFKVTVASGGYVNRGWLDPTIEESARNLSQSSCFILRADWLLPRLLTERDQGGFYSDVLLFPPAEADLYRVFGVDAKRIDADAQLKRGGATVESIVALHNRELQVIPSLYGHTEPYIWRTFDFARDDIGNKSVLEAFAGTVQHDGREIIGTLPNGLHWYYLSDGQGRQVAVVPQNIAIDQRTGVFDAIKDRSVVNAYKCISCHGPVSGIYPFEDVVGKVILHPDASLAVIRKKKEDAVARKEELEEYYLTPLPQRVASQQREYAARVQACNKLDPGPNSVAVSQIVDRYFWAPIDPEQAARESGFPLAEARELWRVSGNPQLVALLAGQPIRRAAWEKAFADGMKAVTWPWERPVEIQKAKRVYHQP